MQSCEKAAPPPNSLKSLPVTLARGRIIPRDEEPDTKRYVIHGNNIAVLSRVNDSKVWALTHFFTPERLTTPTESGRGH
jgi:hypothetical protein